MPSATQFTVKLRQFLYAMLAARFIELSPRAASTVKRR